MTRIIISLGIVFMLTACSADPVAIEYGKDVCFTCKMTLMDSRFGAEIVTQKGKVFKFDDVNCMLNYYHSSTHKQHEDAYVLVVDFDHPGKFIDAQHSWYLKSDSVHSPMASGIAAFENEQSYKQYKKKWNAILLSWGEANTQFK